MNKSELIRTIAEKTCVTQTVAEQFLTAFTNTVIDSVKNGDPVSIVGFGTFDASERAARKGRNPATGEEIDIPASKAPVFKAGKGFKAAIN